MPGAIEAGAEGTVTIAIPGSGLPGEVLVPNGHGSRLLIAYCDQAVPRGQRVVVWNKRDASRVDVQPR
jgi:hypothetical protein